jgi:hypothetical protein
MEDRLCAWNTKSEHYGDKTICENALRKTVKLCRLGHVLRTPPGWDPTHRPPLLPRRYPCYWFLLEAESTPGPYCGRKDYVNEKSHEPIGNRTLCLPACSAWPLPSVPPRTPWEIVQELNFPELILEDVNWKSKQFVVDVLLS